MNTKELIANITRAKWELDNALEENGGELTPELLEQSEIIEDLKALLAEDGIDDLGRWLTSVQSEIAVRKAEADAAARKVKNLKGYEDYVKGLIGQAMDLLELDTNKNGEKVAKGSFYGFKRTTSTKNEINYEQIEEAWGRIAEDAFQEAGLPSWLHVTFKTSVKELQDAGETELLTTTQSPSLSFTKPKADKEK